MSALKREEDIFEWLVDRAWAEHGPDSKDGWENWLLDHWPRWLTIGWWSYLFSNDHGRWDSGLPWINLWSPITDTYELRHWLTGRRWRAGWLFEETMPERIICRIKGHPSGEIYYNPGGDEPNHHCKDCGEEIG